MTNEEFARLKRLGSYAMQLLGEETFRDILADLKNEVIRAWAEALTPEKREECWRDLQAVGRLENALKAIGQSYRAEAQKIANAEKQMVQRQQRELMR
jgi:hypothetical protein